MNPTDLPTPHRATRDDFHDLLARAAAGERLADPDCLKLASCGDLAALIRCAAAIRDRAFGSQVTWSRKAFVPLTRLCRNRCGYCSFATTPRRGERAMLAPDEVLAIARAAQRAGCREALFTLGEKPELRHASLRDELAAHGHTSLLGYLRAMAQRVIDETGLLPHLNPGTLTSEEMTALRPVAASMGLMLETTAERLARRGGPHAGAPDKAPARRLATIAAAGELAVPFTSGILVGIGETRRERVESLLALRALNTHHGQLQEVIVQNFRAKPGTRMATATEPDGDEHLWSIALARIVLDPSVSVQAPPNLTRCDPTAMVAAGLDDWGGVSPVTPDHVNPECPWPGLDELAHHTERAGKRLVERLAIRPRFVQDLPNWVDPAMQRHVRRHADAEGLARNGRWSPGVDVPPRWPDPAPAVHVRDAAVTRALARVGRTGEPALADLVTLFGARGADAQRILDAADALRREVNGDTVGFVVNRNITYTNLCRYRCGFCAFAKGRGHESLRGPRYDFDMVEIARRAREAWDLGATEVCIQGGIHPSYTGQHYLDILATVRASAPGLHVHAFSPLEVSQGARTLGLDPRDFLLALRDAGLGSLPGTAAEILDDDVRRTICPDKLSTREWLDVVGTAHRLGIRSTATIMFGHVDQPAHWARHLLRLRRLQEDTGGFTEFVPLPFVPMEAPLYLRGGARAGPTLREALLMHAVARLALHPVLTHVQASWVKMGPGGMPLCLAAGADDFGGTLVDESISRAAGAAHGHVMSPAQIEQSIRACGRQPRQRETLYADAANERVLAARRAWAVKAAGAPATEAAEPAAMAL